MFTERPSSDKLLQQSVSSMSDETMMRVDSVLEVILLSCIVARDKIRTK